MSNYNYNGNMHPFAAVICHSADSTRITPLLDELSKAGIRLNVLDEKAAQTDSVLKKAFAVLCVLSESFYGSSEMQDILLKTDSMNKELIPMRLDNAAMPELIARLTYATNSINLEKYTPAEAAARIMEAPVMKNPKRTPAQTRFIRIVGIAAAVAVAVIAAVTAISSLSKPVELQPDEPVEINVLAQYGLTEEDLAEIRSIVFAGDELITGEPGDNAWTYLVKTDEGMVRKEDGSILEMGGPEDLSFLQMLPNLQTLVLVNQIAAQLPDLSSLSHLNRVEIWNCDFENLEGLSKTRSLNFLHITSDTITDLSPLSKLPGLATVDITGCRNLTSLDGFNPGAMTRFTIESDYIRDISALAECNTLSELRIESNSLTDYSPLGGCNMLTSVNIVSFDRTVDFSGLGECAKLRELDLASNHTIDLSFTSDLSKLKSLHLDCPNIAGAESVAACTELETFELLVRDEPINRSFDFLSGLHKLNRIKLQGVGTDLEFLQGVTSEDNHKMALELHGSEINWDGLRYVSRFSELNVNTWGNDCSAILDAVRDAEIDHFYLFDCGNIDVTALPTSVKELNIDSSDITSLEGLPCTQLEGLCLGKCWYLSNLSGLEKLEKLEHLQVWDNLRLTDWSAIYGKPLRHIGMTRQYVLPDFGQLSLTKDANICLHEIPEMTDLSCLDALPDSIIKSGEMNVSALGDEIVNLNALLRFKGHRLEVSPLLEEQAQYLVDEGFFNEYAIQYPDENWNMDDVQLKILSLDELDTLPKALLKYVTELNVADDIVYDMDWDTQIWDENDVITAYMFNWQTEEKVHVAGTGTALNMEKLSQLTGLRELRLSGQQMDSLDGIQNLEHLEFLSVVNCDIPDYSAVFALDSLEVLLLDGRNITSIQGIQNLSNLMNLSLKTAEIDDLTPLREMNFCKRAAEEGFTLILPEAWMVSQYPTDLSALAAVPKYDVLNMNSYHGVEFVSYLVGKDIWCAQFLNMFTGPEAQDKFEEFVENAGFIGMMNLCWNDEITDLSCLTKLEGLQRVDISPNMEKAIRSLEGVDYQFELRIEG